MLCVDVQMPFFIYNFCVKVAEVNMVVFFHFLKINAIFEHPLVEWIMHQFKSWIHPALIKHSLVVRTMPYLENKLTL